MKNRADAKYIIISIALIAIIAGIIALVVVPKYIPKTPDQMIEKIDFTNSQWIEQYVDKSFGVYGKDFLQDSAFSYGDNFNKMIVTYASQKSVEEARNYYLNLPGAEQTGINDESSLNVTVEKDGQSLKVYNYFSAIARVFKLELKLSTRNSEKIINQLQKAFPEGEVAKIPEIRDLISGEVYGGYVRYQYDNLDEYIYPNIPIYSRAYIYTGTEADFAQLIQTLKQKYPKNKFDETQNSYYYQINNHIVSLSLLTDNSSPKIVSITIQ